MLEDWRLNAFIVIELAHWFGYEVIGQALYWVIRVKRLRLASVISQFGWFVRLCGRTHLAMVFMLLFSGWSYDLYLLVGGLSALTTVMTVSAVIMSRHAILGVLEIRGN